MLVSKGFIFDFDGVLFDTQRANYLAYKSSLDGFVADFNQDTYRRLRGLDYRQMYAALNIPEHLFSEFRQRKQENYRQLMDHIRPNPEVIRWIRRLTQTDGHLVGICSSASGVNIDAILQSFECAELFPVRVSSDDVENGKPDAEPYRLCLQRLGLSADQAVAFEDSETGVQSAVAAGIQTKLVTTFMKKEEAEDLQKRYAVSVYDFERECDL